jgi:mannan endo-1,4-beta-mannosidase
LDEIRHEMKLGFLWWFGLATKGEPVWYPDSSALVRSALVGLAIFDLLGCSPGWVLAAAPNESALPHAEHPREVPREPVQQASGVFLLGGKPMCFVGSNNYYLIYKSKRMVDDVLDTAKQMGIRVFRHWAFTDRGALDGSVPAVDGDGTKEGHYFQYWDQASQRPAYNDGEQGLEKLDYLLYKARQNDIRIVMVLTNNWRDFGGMDQYLAWYGLTKHQEFYTDERVRQAYKNYVEHLVHRVNTYTGVAYKDDPYIFAWNLANEPRMRNSGPLDDVVGWEPNTITDWVREMSDYIRSIDPSHMISVGDEGFYTARHGAMYSGEEGVNHEALIALDNVDYGTFHLYPDHWSQPVAWGDRWIEDHIVSARKVGKPTVLEEYNIAVRRDDVTHEIVAGGERRALALESWHELVALRGGAGAMFWMLAGYDDYAKSYYKDYDHFSVYTPNVDVTGKTMQAFAERMQHAARACEFALAKPELLAPRRTVPSGFVTTSKPEVVIELSSAERAVE